MSNDLTMYSVQDMSTMAGAIAKSGLFGMKTPEQALALMLVAQAEGMHPATITQDYDIIQGRACRKTHSVMARFQQMGGKVEWHQLDESVADGTFSHPAGGSLRITWTFDQAKKANLTNKDNWKNYPRAMLRARCIAEGIRAVYPAAIGGMMVAEEAQDVGPAEKNVTPNRATATEIAENARQTPPEASPERENLIMDLELVAQNEGIDAYEKAFSVLTKAQRKILGAEEHSRLKAIAQNHNVFESEVA